MEKFAYHIEQLLQEKLSLYEQLRNVLEEEKTNVVDMDVDSLWITVSKKKALALSIEDIKRKIAGLFNKTYSGLNLESQSLSLSYVIKMVNVTPEKRDQFRKINLAIISFKKEINRQVSENKKFINEYLAIIDGVFSTVVNATNKKQYGSYGTVLKNDGRNRLINTEV